MAKLRSSPVRDRRRDVRAAFNEALSVATSEKMGYAELQPLLRMAMHKLGRALVELFLTRCIIRRRPRLYHHRSIAYELDTTALRTSPLVTPFGAVAFTRPIGRPVSGPANAVDLPVDRELGFYHGDAQHAQFEALLNPDGTRTYAEIHDQIDRWLLSAAVVNSEGNLSRAAQQLGVSRKGLRERLKRLEMYEHE